ncbi:xanthine dehydrogenase family protein [bacterium]|nr:xanthine dehydrogenase family protein [bacterium]
MKEKISEVGRSVKRVDAYEKARGESIFTDDLSFPGMLHAGVFRSPCASGAIESLDIAAAKAVEGIKAVLTYKDIPGKNLVPVVFDDQPLLAEKRVRYHGEPIVLLAGESKRAVKEAIKKIKIKIREDKPVLDIHQSMNAKIAVDPEKKDNICQRYDVKRGDTAKAFKTAHLLIENKYSTNYQEHAYLEPQSMIAVPELNGIVSIYGSMQCPFYVQDGVAAILGRELSSISVNLMTTGGAFGGKEDVPSIIAEIAALLSHHTGRPVKFILSREEDLETMSKRHPSYTEYKSAFDKDGKLLGVRVRYYLDAGAYTTLTPVVLWRGVIHAVGPYPCDNVDIEGFGMLTNKVPSGAYRGFGTPQIIFAAETQMDEAAEKLDIDPVKIREINAFKVGDRTATGQKLKESVGIRDTIRAGKKAFKWASRSKKVQRFNAKNSYLKRGIGVASLFYGVGLGARGGPLQKGGALVSLFKDGSVQFSVGTTEMGQGMYTVLSQITADAMGIPMEKVHHSRVSTEKVSDSGPTVASRATFISGNAIKAATDRIKFNLIKFMVSQGMIAANKQIVFKDGHVFARDKKIISVEELALKAWLARVKMIESGWYLPPGTTYAEKDGQGDAYVVYSYVTNYAEVEVDLRTYSTRVVSLYSAEEFGRVINPQLAQGQIEGGNLQGIGYAIYENMVLDNGKIISNNFSTYLIPTLLDVGELMPVIVEKPYTKGPFGAKGMGEMPLMGIAPAVGNAVKNAVGQRLRNIPLTQEQLYEKLKDN